MPDWNSLTKLAWLVYGTVGGACFALGVIMGFLAGRLAGSQE